MTIENYNSPHLSEDQLEDVLLGIFTADCSRHLEACPACRAQLAQFQSTVALFSQASNAWSEARSNALNRDLKQHRTPFRFSARTAWTCASALVLLIVVTVGIGFRQHSGSIMAAQAEQRRIQFEASLEVEANAKNEIASDNAILLQIDAAINNSEPSPQQLYGIPASSGASAQRSQHIQVKD